MDLINDRGKEANIFSDYEIVYKIYKKGIDITHKEIKLDILSSIAMDGLICPKQKIINTSLRGYTMDYVDGTYITDLDLTNLEITKLFKRLSNLLKHYHKYGIILADINMTNILVKTLEEVYFCDVDSCKIFELPNDSIPFLTNYFLTHFKINLPVDEKLDNLSLFLLFLYVIFDRRNIFQISEYDIDKTLEEKGLDKQRVFVKKFKNNLTEVPYLEELL